MLEPRKVSEILSFLEEKAPNRSAESWDNVGLLVGNPEKKTKGAVISVDLTRAALNQAKKSGFSLIVIHHPCIFPAQKGLKQVTQGGAKDSDLLNSVIFDAVKAGISVVCSHTNFDQCALEVPELISKGLGIVPKGRLGAGSVELKKLVVFVPIDHLDAVRAAVTTAGAGRIGQYDQCTFSTDGMGTFRGSESTHPFLGKPGQLEKAREVRFETVFPTGLQSVVLKALFESHPYEEVAYDLYSLDQKPGSVGMIPGLGYGFWGEYENHKYFSDVIRCVIRLFNLEGYWITEPIPKKIRRIGFAAGSGGSVLEAALASKCDLMITGESGGYHSAIGSARKGMAVLEMGHRQSEKFFLKVMADWIKKAGLKTVIHHELLQRVHGVNLRR